MNPFDPERFHRALATRSLGRDFHYFASLESTNSWLKSTHEPSPVHGSVCLADTQSAGRGQYKRSWVSEPARNLTWSIAFKPDRHDRLFLLTLACMFAVAETVDELMPEARSAMKWPNDLMLGGRKVGGVLAESVFNGNHLDRFVVGIGLNVNQPSFPPDLPFASSLQLQAQREFDREQLLADILVRTEKVYVQWESGDRQLVKSINERLIGYGAKVKAEVDGKARPEPLLMLGINADGYLHLMDDAYNVHTFAYEQVRLHPVEDPA